MYEHYIALDWSKSWIRDEKSPVEYRKSINQAV